MQPVQWFACNGVHIEAADVGRVWPVCRPFRTYSVYHNEDQLWAVDYNAPSNGVFVPNTRPNQENWMDWQPLRFHWRDDGSSFIEAVGERDTLQFQHPYQTWVQRLLPPRYHAPVVDPTSFCGLCGHLPLLMALIVLGQPPNMTRFVLERSLINGQWQPQPTQPQRMSVCT